MEMVVLVHPQLGLRFGAALPGLFFLRKTTLLRKNNIFYDFQMIFHQKWTFCYELEEPLSKPAS